MSNAKKQELINLRAKLSALLQTAEKKKLLTKTAYGKLFDQTQSYSRASKVKLDDSIDFLNDLLKLSDVPKKISMKNMKQIKENKHITYQLISMLM